MSNLKRDIEALEQALCNTLQLINSYDNAIAKDSIQPESDFHAVTSLLERCNQVVKNSTSKPKLRIVHHLACSGGTLVSKCLAALPNVHLLSELHPTTVLHQGGGKPKFLPSDVTTQARYANVPNIENLAWKLFKSNITDTYEHLTHYSGTLVIRDHTHSDFCVGNDYSQCSTVARLLANDFELLRVVTLRDPIDSYISLVKNNWVHFEPKTFDEYCKRIWAFISEYNASQIFKYEDFVKSPIEEMKKISGSLELTFNDSFIDTFSLFKVTGDSGRSGDVIEERTRRDLTTEELNEFSSSKYYAKIAKRFNYRSLENYKSD